MNIITKPSESRRGENNFFKKKTNKQTKKTGTGEWRNSTIPGSDLEGRFAKSAGERGEAIVRPTKRRSRRSEKRREGHRRDCPLSLPLGRNPNLAASDGETKGATSATIRDFFVQPNPPAEAAPFYAFKRNTYHLGPARHPLFEQLIGS